MNGSYGRQTDDVNGASDRNAFETVDGQVLRHPIGSAAVAARFQTTKVAPERRTSGFEPTETLRRWSTETIGLTKTPRRRPTSPTWRTKRARRRATGPRRETKPAPKRSRRSGRRPNEARSGGGDCLEGPRAAGRKIEAGSGGRRRSGSRCGDTWVGAGGSGGRCGGTRVRRSGKVRGRGGAWVASAGAGRRCGGARVARAGAGGRCGGARAAREAAVGRPGGAWGGAVQRPTVPELADGLGPEGAAPYRPGREARLKLFAQDGMARRSQGPSPRCLDAETDLARLSRPLRRPRLHGRRGPHRDGRFCTLPFLPIFF
jgi:hypothetical protein